MHGVSFTCTLLRRFPDATNMLAPPVNAMHELTTALVLRRSSVEKTAESAAESVAEQLDALSIDTPFGPPFSESIKEIARLAAKQTQASRERKGRLTNATAPAHLVAQRYDGLPLCWDEQPCVQRVVVDSSSKEFELVSSHLRGTLNTSAQIGSVIRLACWRELQSSPSCHDNI